MSKPGTVSFWLVMLGQTINVIYTIASVGTYVPRSTPGEIVATFVITLIFAGVQVFALYSAAKHSKHEGRWAIASLMMIVSFAGIVCYSKAGGDYVVALNTDVFLAIVFAVGSCGTLLWLRSKPAVRS